VLGFIPCALSDITVRNLWPRADTADIPPSCPGAMTVRSAPKVRRSVLIPVLVTLSMLSVVVARPPEVLASNHEQVVDLTFPVAGPTTYIDDYLACRGGAGCPRRHLATDLMTAYGQEVHAAVAGTIRSITGLDGNPPSWGYAIEIDGVDGRRYHYIHLGRQDGPPSEAYASGLVRGSPVDRGQLIGFAGCSGNASCSAPHLHFEISDPAVVDPYGGNRINPYASLQAAQERGDLPRNPMPVGASPLVGDFNGDGVTNTGYRAGTEFVLRMTDGRVVRFWWGLPTDVPIMGDWNGDGRDTIGLIRGREWLLRNSNNRGTVDLRFSYGHPSDTFIAGDWNGDGRDTPGVRRGWEWILRTSPGAGPADLRFGFGQPTDIPVVGDWNGNGVTTVGVVRGNIWLLRDANSRGPVTYDFLYGAASDTPVAGNWNSNGRHGVGLNRRGSWLLRYEPSSGPVDLRLNWSSQ
jgi:hypothetical protein